MSAMTENQRDTLVAIIRRGRRKPESYSARPNDKSPGAFSAVTVHSLERRGFLAVERRPGPDGKPRTYITPTAKGRARAELYLRGLS